MRQPGTMPGKEKAPAYHSPTVSDEQEVSDSDPDTDSSSDELELDEADTQAMMRLEQELEANPNLYDKHLEYIAILRKAGLKERLRSAHQRMASLFPLSESLWLEYVNDELEGVSGAEDISRLLELLARCTEDYVSVQLWATRLELTKELDADVATKTTEGLQRYRQLCEDALTAAGLHVAEGARLWNAYRQFEMEVEGAGLGGDRQEERVRSLFQRQLAVPLMGAEESLDAYRQWEAEHGKAVPPHVLKAYEKAQEAVDLRRSNEDAVSPGKPVDVVLLGAYMSYIRLEQVQGDPARVQLVYERAIAAFPVTHSLWLQYAQYLEQHLKIPSVIHRVYKRAVRNCYWLGSVWARAIRAQDRFPGSEEEQDQLYQHALKAGLQDAESYLEVILAHLDYLRHRCQTSTSAPASSPPQAAANKLRQAFSDASELMLSYFPDYLDLSFRLPAYWAHCEAHVLGNMEGARAVWENTLKGGLGRHYEAWAAYIAMERSQCNLREARGIYKRCHSRKLEAGGQVALCQDWLRFEREEGSAEDLFHAQLKVEPILEEAAAASVAAADTHAAALAKAAAQQAPKLSKEEMKKLRQQNDPHFKGKQEAVAGISGKRIRDEVDHGNDEPSSTKKARAVEPQQQTLPSAPQPLSTLPASAAADQDLHDTEMQEAGPSTSASVKQQAAAAKQWYTDNKTIFVKGLRYQIRDGELDEVFRPCGDFKEVRLLRDPMTGKCKGMAYVEFTSEQGLQNALELTGTPFQGLILNIARSKPPPSGGGRGRGGRGRGSSPSPPPFAGRGGGRGTRMPVVAPPSHHRQHLQIETDAPAQPSKPSAFMPRSVAAKAAQNDQGSLQPKSNDDFRKLLLKK